MPTLAKRTLLLLALQKACRTDLFDFCEIGYGVSIRSERRQENRRRFHNLAAGGFCRASRNAIMVLANPTIIELDMGKLDDLLQRVDARELHAEDYSTIQSLIESYKDLYFAVGDKNTSHRAAAEAALRREDREDGEGGRATSAGEHSGRNACGIACG